MKKYAKEGDITGGSNHNFPIFSNPLSIAQNFLHFDFSKLHGKVLIWYSACVFMFSLFLFTCDDDVGDEAIIKSL